MIQKYVDGLPLARQEKIWASDGISLSRATMANWVIQCSQSWLKPLYKHMKQELLTHSVIHADVKAELLQLCEWMNIQPVLAE